MELNTFDAFLIVPNSPTPRVSDGNRSVVSDVLIVSYQTLIPAGIAQSPSSNTGDFTSCITQ